MRKEMFNPLRLFRRRDHIDDIATAYIEGSMMADEKAELESRMAKEPGLREELDSLKSTVTLLRSVETARAPRSFALSHAPVRERRRRAAHRLAMAPAALAVAAAAGIGLLAVGNMADVVTQSGSSESQTNRQADLDEQNDQLTITPEFDATPDDAVTALPMSTPTAIGTMAPPENSEGAAEPDAGLPTPGPSERSNGEPDTTRDPDHGFSTTGTAESGAPSTSTLESQELNGEMNTALASPDTTVARAGDSGAVSLPVWQTQVALGLIAGAMVALWAYMRRKATR